MQYFDNICNMIIRTEIQVQPAATMIVNGQVVSTGEEVHIPVRYVNCICGNRLINFQPGESLEDCINESNNVISKSLRFCPMCGRKLIYNADIINVSEFEKN